MKPDMVAGPGASHVRRWWAETRAEAVVVPCEARDLYLAYPGDSEEETCPEDPGTRRVASFQEGEDLVNQMEEGRVTA